MIKPLEDRVLILQDEARKETEGGVLIPDAVQQKPAAGTIAFIGPGKQQGNSQPIGYMFNDEFVTEVKSTLISDRVVPVYKTDLQVGDKVLFARHAGIPVSADGKEYLIMRFSDIICRM